MLAKQDFSNIKGLALEFCIGISTATREKPNHYLDIAKNRLENLVYNLGGSEYPNVFTAIIGLWAIREDVVLGIEVFEKNFGREPECLKNLLKEMEEMYKSLFRL